MAELDTHDINSLVGATYFFAGVCQLEMHEAARPIL